jgi:hypothetical protein
MGPTGPAPTFSEIRCGSTTDTNLVLLCPDIQKLKKFADILNFDETNGLTFNLGNLSTTTKRINFNGGNITSDSDLLVKNRNILTELDNRLLKGATYFIRSVNDAEYLLAGGAWDARLASRNDTNIDNRYRWQIS